jgi:hypothetical protein
MRELQALCLDVATYKLDVQENANLKEYEINLMSENIENSGIITDFSSPLRKIDAQE